MPYIVGRKILYNTPISYFHPAVIKGYYLYILYLFFKKYKGSFKGDKNDTFYMMNESEMEVWYITLLW